MNKKLFFAAVLAIVMIASFNISALEKKVGDISLLNIEALSSIENGTNIYCLWIGTLDCPVSGVKTAYIW